MRFIRGGVLCLVAACVAVTPAGAQRQRLSMDPGWHLELQAELVRSSSAMRIQDPRFATAVAV